jgi:hypothetical protein
MFAGFIRTLATIVLVWFAFRWLDRMFGGRRSQSNSQSRANKRRQTGDTKSDSRKPKDENIGEYVDFEEIEE